MVLLTRFGIIVLFFFSLSVWAEDIKLKPDHPQQYTVVKNDTLWSIAGKFLHHPSQWPLLWSENKQITNPNLIYPGDTIYFSMVNGKPQLSLSRNSSLNSGNSTCVIKEAEYINGRKVFERTKDGKMAQCIRESDIKDAIRLIPYKNVAKYLSSPRVVGKDELSNAPYVIDFAGNHVVAGAGQNIYVRGLSQATTLNYVIYRPGQTFISPDTGKILGYEAKYVADVTLVQQGDPSTFNVTRSEREIRKGDRLMERVEHEVTLNFFARPPKKQITGSIIGVLGSLNEIGADNIVVIDRGRLDGLLPGHELDIFQRGRVESDSLSGVTNDTVKLPDVDAGKLMVFRTFDHLSFALVMHTHRAIHVLDLVQTP
jgi:hypothetical protein